MSKLNIAVLIQGLGFALMFFIGRLGLPLGVAVVFVGGLMYRRERKRLKQQAADSSSQGGRIA